MSSYDQLTLNTVVNLQVVTNSIIPYQYINAKVTGPGISFALAKNYGTDIAALHAQLYPLLPQGTPTDPTQLAYYVFQIDTNIIVLAKDWIIPTSILVQTSRDLQYTITAVTPERQTFLNNLLKANGFTIGNVTQL